MSERIDEILFRTGVTQHSFSDPRHPDLDGYIVSDEKLNNLIEQVVRECLALCDDVQSQYLKHRKSTSDFSEKNIYAEGEAACDVIKFKMKHHFGIDK